MTAEDNRTPMGHPLVVLGYAYWQRRFGGDPSIVGQKVAVDGMPMTVIGVSGGGISQHRSRERGGSANPDGDAGPAYAGLASPGRPLQRMRQIFYYTRYLSEKWGQSNAPAPSKKLYRNLP